MAKYLVTPALPYANGPIHLGHLVEHVQVSIYVRALRMAGEDVLCVCGADSHGTPIELNAMKAGKEPEQYAADWQKSHAATFDKFFIEFDGGYGSTHTPLNKKHAERIYGALEQAGYVTRRDVEQLFDPEAGRFLPDRMVRGTCPKCGTPDQYGDSCESCNSTYSPTDLKDPKSVISGATPVMKSSEHYFVSLGKFTKLLQDFTSSDGRVPAGIKNYLDRWFADGLQDWDISRDGPYFGFPIPGADDKYFYVWLDAPIGYISLSEKAAQEKGRTFEEYWNDPDTRIVHFIGKDIVYFHTLFWPAMLSAAGHTLPLKYGIHGMLTVDGVKMSKSRGTFIMADALADALGPIGVQALRYYYACKLTSGIDDIDLSLDDFIQRVNTDLVNKIVNLMSRTVPMLHRYCDGKVGPTDPAAQGLLDEARARAAKVEHLYRDLEYAQVVREVVAIADGANKYLQDEKPWDVAKTNVAKAQMQLSTALYVGKLCMGLLGPIIPDASQKAAAMVGAEGGFTFASALAPLAEGLQLLPYDRLFERLDKKAVHSLVVPSETGAADGKKAAKAKTGQKAADKQGKAKKEAAKKDEGPPAEIKVDDFFKVELRAAQVKKATDVEGADKLISVTLDVGPLGERHVFTGLKPHVQPAELEGQMVALVANLKPRKMKFGLSEGMILAAGDKEPKPVFVPGAKPGDRIT